MKLEDIRREQQYQREREAAFRDLSEDTNSRAVWYTLAQMGVLIATCVWQLRHLRVSGQCRVRSALFINVTILDSGSSRTGKCINALISLDVYYDYIYWAGLPGIGCPGRFGGGNWCY